VGHGECTGPGGGGKAGLIGGPGVRKEFGFLIVLFSKMHRNRI
jgi:hypothetical protein